MENDQSFDASTFSKICDSLATTDQHLGSIISQWGYPPMWTRPNTFETLVHIILEQQVSLASALASLNKLREYLPVISPENVLALSDDELKACYFSRQKIIYVKGLAEAIVNGKLDLIALEELSNDEIRQSLLQLKGIGNWTIDVYLMFVLQRSDIFPIGDLAAVNALKQLKNLPLGISREEITTIAANWKPNRTIATMILWHHYLAVRKRLA